MSASSSLPSLRLGLVGGHNMLKALSLPSLILSTEFSEGLPRKIVEVDVRLVST